MKKVIKSFSFNISIGLSAIVWLIICQLGFSFIQKGEANRSVKAILVGLRQDLDSSNFQYIARGVSDLENLGVIRCPILRRTGDNPIEVLNLTYKGNCNSSFLLLDGSPVHTELRSLNGDTWSLSFKSSNNWMFYFSLWTFRLVGLLLIISLLILVRRKLAYDRMVLESDRKLSEGMRQVAEQLAHDIRSPLAALQAVIHHTHELDEETRIHIRTAVNRIRDIANGLLEKHRKVGQAKIEAITEKRDIEHPESAVAFEPLNAELLYPAVEASVSQMQIQYSQRDHIKVRFTSSESDYGIFARFKPSEMNRIISNLINNSFEAIDMRGTVEVFLRRDSGFARLTIHDNGKGIPKDILSELGKRGFTFGKKEGNGLGIWHAKKTIESWGGSFTIESEVRSGTTVTILLPISGAPKWFAGSLNIPNDGIIVVADDDPSIHQIWKQRFSNEYLAGLRTVLVNIHSAKELLGWYRNNLPENMLFLCDYEFSGEAQSGIDLIEMLGVNHQSVLVTSRWYEAIIRQRCEKLGILLLPKSLAGSVPITANIDTQNE